MLLDYKSIINQKQLDQVKLKCLHHEETIETSNKDGHRSKFLSIQGLKYTIKETQQPNHM